MRCALAGSYQLHRSVGGCWQLELYPNYSCDDTSLKGRDRHTHINEGIIRGIIAVTVEKAQAVRRHERPKTYRCTAIGKDAQTLKKTSDILSRKNAEAENEG